jgi:hypothetical protein
MADIFVDSFEHPCLRRAAEDLCSDLAKITGVEPCLKQYLPTVEPGPYILAGALDNERFSHWLKSHGLSAEAIAGAWEQYLIKSQDGAKENIVICGSDRRGAMWGIYHFCEYFLDVDPQYFWTDREPKKREELVFDPIDIRSGPCTYKFRGWFINDEDLLTEWKDGGGARHIEYPFYHQVTHQSIIEKAVETALRLRQNLLIPASFLDILNPPEENLARIAVERGLFVSQHHVEPMGVSHFAWDNYWQGKGKHPEPSFVENPELFREIWTDYARRWSPYGENLIWQLGLRGRGDRPVWNNDPRVPDSPEGRGALISKAIQMQHDILAEVLGRKDFFCSTTLWMEGGELFERGNLSIPEKTIIVFADTGWTQMWGADFHQTPRRKAYRYGGYYHVAFWGAGPHLAQITSPEKIYHNFRQAVEKGDTEYSILNVSNIREFSEGIRQVAELTWDFDRFDLAKFLSEYSRKEYGCDLSGVYKAYYRSFSPVEPEPPAKGKTATPFNPAKASGLPDHEVVMDGVARMYGLTLLNILAAKGEERDRLMEEQGGVLNFCAKHFPAALEKWRKTYGELYAAEEQVAPERREFYADHILLQAETMLALYEWLGFLWEALKNGEKAYIAEAAYALERYLVNRQRAEHGKWRQWYRGDKKMNLPAVLEKTRSLLP